MAVQAGAHRSARRAVGEAGGGRREAVFTGIVTRIVLITLGIVVPPTITQRLSGLILCALLGVLGVSYGLLIFREIFMLLVHLFVPQSVASSESFSLLVKALALISFTALCGVSVFGCRRFWSHLLTQNDANKTSWHPAERSGAAFTARRETSADST